MKGVGDSVGVQGKGIAWHGVEGISDSTIGGFGVHGVHTAGGTGVVGESTGWIAVGGFASSESKGAAVYGEHKGGQAGVWGNNTNDTNQAGPGVVGTSKATGVVGESKTWNGVYGKSESTTGGAGVWGEAVGLGPGVIGFSKASNGVYAKSESTTGGAGVWSEAVGPGVVGVSKTWHGVYGETNSVTGGAGVYGKGRIAGFFEGDVEVTGDIRLRNADCAEDFTVGAQVLAEPGSVMVLGEEGALFPCLQAYDKRVAGVVSGAGDFKPGIVLDKQDSLENRSPIALIGKVYCKVDAAYGAIEIGDLLTTSPTLGHAMKAADPLKAFGAIIGKALRPLQEGQGLIPILVALQ